jgi:hypothetical protein
MLLKAMHMLKKAVSTSLWSTCICPMEMGGARRVMVGDVEYRQVAFQNTKFVLKPNITQLLNVLLSAVEDVIKLTERLKANETALLEANAETRRKNEKLFRDPQAKG